MGKKDANRMIKILDIVGVIMMVENEMGEIRGGISLD